MKITCSANRNGTGKNLVFVEFILTKNLASYFWSSIKLKPSNILHSHVEKYEKWKILTGIIPIMYALCTHSAKLGLPFAILLTLESICDV